VCDVGIRLGQAEDDAAVGLSRIHHSLRSVVDQGRQDGRLGRRQGLGGGGGRRRRGGRRRGRRGGGLRGHRRRRCAGFGRGRRVHAVGLVFVGVAVAAVARLAARHVLILKQKKRVKYEKNPKIQMR
jgi:hypothetical protein